MWVPILILQIPVHLYYQKIRRMKKLILLVLIAVFSVNLFAQEECAFILEEAQEMFNAGLIETIPDKLAGCLDDGFTNEEQLQAFKIVILSFLFDDNIEKADEFMLKFLTNYPAYEPVATDPREFVVLMDSYDRDPVLMIGGGIGANISLPIPTLLQGINDFADHDGDYTPGGPGLNLSFQLERRLFDKLVLSGEFIFTSNRFDYYLNNDDPDIIPSAEITDFSDVHYTESQISFRMPVSLIYEFTSTDFKPYVRLGLSPGLLLSASGKSTRQYVNTEITYALIRASNVDLIAGRRVFNLWAYAGAGFNAKLGPGNFFVDVRYYANLLNQVRPGTKSFMFQELIWSHYYVSDKFLLNSFGLTIGYMIPIYRPKKKGL